MPTLLWALAACGDPGQVQARTSSEAVRIAFSSRGEGEIEPCG